MSAISTFLEKIKTAVFGEEVRGAIHDSIQQCYTDVTNAKTLADDSISKARKATTDANTALTNANTALDKANKMNSTVTEATNAANTAANAANNSKNACDTAVKALPTTITNMFGSLGLVLVDGKLCVGVEQE